MTPDQYLLGLLAREAVDTGLLSPVRSVQSTIQPVIREWAGSQLLSVTPSGSFAKGTANRSGTDIDLFISLSETTTNTLREIYDTLHGALGKAGYTPRKQNVSLNVRIGGYSVDLVPGKRQQAWGTDHSIYRRKAETWTKTNVSTHATHILGSGFTQEMRLLKLWRNQKGLDFPSFYLELTVMAGLTGVIGGTLSERTLASLRYVCDRVETARVVDPANTANILSDELNATEKARLAASARAALSATNWAEIIK